MASVRKKQSEIKSIVSAFGNLILSWKNQVYEIEKLLIGLQRLYLLIESIQRTLSKGRLKCFENFSQSLGSVLVGKICEDIEGLYAQLQNFW